MDAAGTLSCSRVNASIHSKQFDKNSNYAQFSTKIYKLFIAHLAQKLPLMESFWVQNDKIFHFYLYNFFPTFYFFQLLRRLWKVKIAQKDERGQFSSKPPIFIPSFKVFRKLLQNSRFFGGFLGKNTGSSKSTFEIYGLRAFNVGIL